MRRPGFLAGPLLPSTPFTTISFVFLYFYFIELSETKMPHLADLFFCPQVSDFGLVVCLASLVLTVRGLDTRIWPVFGDWRLRNRVETDSGGDSNATLCGGMDLLSAREWLVRGWVCAAGERGGGGFGSAGEDGVEADPAGTRGGDGGWFA